MKKSISILLVVLGICIIGATAAFGSGAVQFPGAGNNQRQCNQYVDADNNGVCDNCQNGNGRHFVDNDGDGICDYRANRPNHPGKNFVDNDNDGICDNAGNNGCPNHQGCGQGRCGNN